MRNKIILVIAIMIAICGIAIISNDSHEKKSKIKYEKIDTSNYGNTVADILVAAGSYKWEIPARTLKRPDRRYTVPEIDETEISIVAGEKNLYNNTTALRMRALPSLYADIVGVLYLNNDVHVLGTVEKDDYWVQIETANGDIAYVAQEYLGESKIVVQKKKKQQQKKNYTYKSDGKTLNPRNGVVYGPSGKETYYNLNMNKIVNKMKARGIEGEYWVRDDGVKMLGDYVMVAANLQVHPRGSIVETSLGTGMVCDTGSFASSSPNQLDIATSW